MTPNLTIIDAGVPCHQQDTDIYCGEAAVQMILAGLSPAQPTPVQQDMSPQLSLGPGGGTLPSALETVLNAASHNGLFHQQCDGTFEDGCSRILGALLTQQAGVPVLVYGSGHWIVVTGVRFVRGADETYTIFGFSINNPSPQTAVKSGAVPPSSNKPMPHVSHDKCGSGGPYGSRDTYVALPDWKQTYWYEKSTAIKGESGFITVPAGAYPLPKAMPVSWPPGSTGSPAPALEPLEPLEPFLAEQSTMRELPGPDDREERAKQAAKKGIEDHGIALGGAGPDHFENYELGDLTYHTELGDPPRHSYQIRLMRDGRQIGTAAVNAETNEFLGVQAPANIMPTRHQMQDIALRALERHADVLGDVFGPFDLAHRLFTVHPTLVWRPCLQSMSRYYPFVQVNLAGAIVYVTLDGRLFRRLTSHERG